MGTNVNSKKNPDGSEKSQWNQTYSGSDVLMSCQKELVAGNQLFKQGSYQESMLHYKKCWHFAFQCPKSTKKLMSDEERLLLLKHGSDGLNNYARCLINLGKYSECLEVISSGNAKQFGDNLKLCKVFVVALFNIGQLEECSDYLRKCEKLLEEIIEKRVMDEEYEKGIDIDSQKAFLTKYYNSVREKAIAENWAVMPKGPLSPKKPDQNPNNAPEPAKSQWKSS